MLCELKKVTKIYGAEPNAVMPVHELDFSIDRGQYISVGGESGVGKSTLLFMIGGMLRPSSGEIYFDGQEYGAMSDDRISALRAANIGYISQNVQMAQALTIEENIRLAQNIALRFGGDKENAPDVDHIINYLGLDEKRDELPSRLSGGQKRRAMIGVTWARNPQLFLLDEPTNDLDDEWSERVMSLLDDWKAAGKAILLVTHNQQYVRRAETCLRLKNGKLISMDI